MSAKRWHQSLRDRSTSATATFPSARMSISRPRTPMDRRLAGPRSRIQLRAKELMTPVPGVSREARADAASDSEGAPPDPAQALERIELPAEVSALISERLWTGGSLIITDESLSDETSDVGTDLVVTMR